MARTRTTIVKPSSSSSSSSAKGPSSPADEVGWLVFDVQGNRIAEGFAPTRSAAQTAADRHWTRSRWARVQGSYTSDGTYFGPGRGRLLASRDPGMDWHVELYTPVRHTGGR